jgi:HAD superfamily hydrolase (TIGR01509 family)
MNTFHQENTHLIRPFDGARPLLDRLRSQVKLAIWTGRDRGSAERLLVEYELDSLFSVVVCGDDLPTHKPDPEGLQEIMQRLGVGAAETIFVGDADVDVLGGVAAGVPTILIQHGRDVDPAIDARAWRRVDTPVAALAAVLRCVESDQA